MVGGRRADGHGAAGADARRAGESDLTDETGAGEALRLLETSRTQANTQEGMQIAYDARLGWALTLAGHADSSDAYYRPFERELTRRPEWRYRMARAALALGDDIRAFRLLKPLA